MKKNNAEELLIKYAEGRCTPEEQLLVEAGFLDDFKKGYHEVPAKEIEAAKRNIQLGIDHHVLANPKRKAVRLWPRVAAAASIILCLGVGGYFYLNTKPTEQLAQDPLNSEIAPGGNKAFLTLSNGQRISLTDAANGSIAKQSGITITKTADGQVIYAVEHNGHIALADEYNTIETPKGGQYQVRLPDGTKVWLNAASSLKYPASFASRKERRVELTGEGYFEVAKDKAHPFIVATEKEEVQVLGTHFNISAYADEMLTKTTLLEGSINLTANGKGNLLKPGQQARLSNSGIAIAKVDADEAIAWKNGYFEFNSDNLESAMQKIARWYDVDIEYKNESLKTQQLGGTISRYASVGQILKKIELTGVIHFEVKGRKIIVK